MKSGYDSNGIYVYQLEAGDAKDSVVLGMLAKNKLDCVIPYSVKYWNQDVFVGYDLKGVRPLSKYMEEGLSTSTFIRVLIGVCEAALTFREYMIPLKNIETGCDYIYIPDNSDSIKFICYPQKLSNQPEKKLASVLCSLLHRQKRVPESARVIGEIENYMYSGEASADPREMIRFLKTLENSCGLSTMVAPDANLNCYDYEECVDLDAERVARKEKKKEKRATKQKNKSAVVAYDFQIPQAI